jgi:hypothetical protein
MKTFLKALATIALISAPAFAEGDFSGSGCPAGSATAVLSPDGTTLSVLFDSFAAEAQPGVSSASSQCSFRIPINVPAGSRVGVYKIDYRGYVMTPRKASAELRVDYTTLGAHAPSFHRNFSQGRDEEFTLTDTIGAGMFRESGCGTPFELAGNASLSLQLRDTSAGGMVVLDSFDGAPKGGLVYHLKWRPCH